MEACLLRVSLLCVTVCALAASVEQGSEALSFHSAPLELPRLLPACFTLLLLSLLLLLALLVYWCALAWVCYSLPHATDVCSPPTPLTSPHLTSPHLGSPGSPECRYG